MDLFPFFVYTIIIKLAKRTTNCRLIEPWGSLIPPLRLVNTVGPVALDSLYRSPICLRGLMFWFFTPVNLNFLSPRLLYFANGFLSKVCVLFRKCVLVALVYSNWPRVRLWWTIDEPETLEALCSPLSSRPNNQSNSIARQADTANTLNLPNASLATPARRQCWTSLSDQIKGGR